jgi:hypothetical protein
VFWPPPRLLSSALEPVAVFEVGSVAMLVEKGKGVII